jgi:transcriptional regulator with XRE-family HTH domain
MSESNLPNLKRLRVSRGMNRAQLGAALGVTERTIYRWEAGENDPKLTELRLMAAYFKISVSTLIGERALADPDTSPAR